MKKFLDFLARGKQKKENFCSLYDASFPDISQNDIYKFYQFDSDCSRNAEVDYEILLDPKTDNPNKLQESSEVFLESSDNLLNEPLLPFFREQEKHQLEDKNKFRKTIRVINISNSRYFHVGSQKTINITEKQLLKNIEQDLEVQLCIDSHTSKLKIDWNKLLDCDEKLTEEYITLISLHLKHCWEEFVKYLGLEITFLKTLESRNDNNGVLILYDALQKYLKQFPNTSLGFVIYVLIEIRQIALVEKLAQELKS